MSASQIRLGIQAEVKNGPQQMASEAPSRGAGTPAGVTKSVRRREMTLEERHQMIAEAAYYRALRRGFHGGSDLEDWLDAEAEMEKLLWHG